MNKHIKILILAAFLFITPCLVYAKSWHFMEWKDDIIINSDSTFTVFETQTVKFEGSFSFLRRDIALQRFKKLSSIRVFDENGRLLDSDETKIGRDNGKVFVKIKFHVQDEIRTWTIEYTVHGGIGFFDDHDELYWNAVSEERDVPIDRVEVYVHLPQEIPRDKLMQRLLAGPTGSNNESPNYTISDDRTLAYWGDNIGPYDNFTIVAGIPKGIIKPIDVTESDNIEIYSQNDPLTYLWFIVPLFTFIFLFLRWRTKGQDPRVKETIVAQYKPPESLSPAEMSALIHEKLKARDISATLIDLAYRGYIKIIEQEKKKFLTTSKTYILQKQKNFTNDLNLKEHESLILGGIFEDKYEVALDDLKDKFYTKIPEIRKAIFAQIVQDGYFQKPPGKVKVKYIIFGILIILSGFTGLFFSQFMTIIAIGLAGVLTIVFGQFMPVKTQKGSYAKWYVQGFREYLYVAERFRLEANLDPNTFEKYLSYAIILGVEKRWADRFIDIYNQPPDWYISSSDWTGFTITDFANDLDSMTNSFSTSLASSPSSSSGFSSSGGAGGGGGGGASSAG